jgi:hypothetical protein
MKRSGKAADQGVADKHYLQQKEQGCHFPVFAEPGNKHHDDSQTKYNYIENLLVARY